MHQVGEHLLAGQRDVQDVGDQVRIVASLLDLAGQVGRLGQRHGPIVALPGARSRTEPATVDSSARLSTAARVHHHLGHPRRLGSARGRHRGSRMTGPADPPTTARGLTGDTERTQRFCPASPPPAGGTTRPRPTTPPPPGPCRPAPPAPPARCRCGRVRRGRPPRRVDLPEPGAAPSRNAATASARSAAQAGSRARSIRRTAQVGSGPSASASRRSAGSSGPVGHPPAAHPHAGRQLDPAADHRPRSATPSRPTADHRPRSAAPSPTADSAPQGGAEPVGRRDRPVPHRGRLGRGQRAIGRPHHQRERQRPVSGRDLVPGVDVEQPQRLEQLAGPRRAARRGTSAAGTESGTTRATSRLHRRERADRRRRRGLPLAAGRPGSAPARRSAAADPAAPPPWAPAHRRSRSASRRPGCSRTGPDARAPARRRPPGPATPAVAQIRRASSTASAQPAGRPAPHQPERSRAPASTAATCSGWFGQRRVEPRQRVRSGRRSTPTAGGVGAFLRGQEHRADLEHRQVAGSAGHVAQHRVQQSGEQRGGHLRPVGVQRVGHRAPLAGGRRPRAGRAGPDRRRSGTGRRAPRSARPR